MDAIQPFCDIDISPEDPCSAEEYEEIMNKIEKSASRDLKFSDTVIQISSLDLYKITNYKRNKLYITGVQRGVHFGSQHGFIFGCAITGIAAVVLYLISLI